MRDPKDPVVYLKHIRDAIQKIERYTAGGHKEFLQSTMAQDAVVRNLEVVGEAVRSLPLEFRRRHTEIPWRSMAALRNVLIHEYFGVDLEIVWRISKKRVPILKRYVEHLLSK